MSTPKAAAPPVYQGWRQVPEDLRTRTQLVEADLPRTPGPVAAYVKTYDWRDTPDTVPLYDVRQAPPSKASAAQLAAAARRRAPASRVCGECGAYPEAPPLPGVDDSMYRCLACRHIARVRGVQTQTRQWRAAAAVWARTLLAEADPQPVVVRAAVVLRAPAPSGRQNPGPIAVRVDAVDHTGARLLAATVRATTARVRSMPADVVDAGEVAEPLARIASGVRVVTWSESDLYPVRRLLPSPARLPGDWYGGNPNALRLRVAQWRGEVDPHTAQMRIPYSPGRADRMWLLLSRMAESGQS